jgi:hypothetical protein
VSQVKEEGEGMGGASYVGWLGCACVNGPEQVEGVSGAGGWRANLAFGLEAKPAS